MHFGKVSPFELFFIQKKAIICPLRVICFRVLFVFYFSCYFGVITYLFFLKKICNDFLKPVLFNKGFTRDITYYILTSINSLFCLQCLAFNITFNLSRLIVIFAFFSLWCNGRFFKLFRLAL